MSVHLHLLFNCVHRREHISLHVAGWIEHIEILVVSVIDVQLVNCTLVDLSQLRETICTWISYGIYFSQEESHVVVIVIYLQIKIKELLE